MFNQNFMGFNAYPLLLIQPTGTTEKNLAPSSSFPPIKHLETRIRWPMNLLLSRLNKFHLPQPLHVCETLHFLSHLWGLIWGSGPRFLIKYLMRDRWQQLNFSDLPWRLWSLWEPPMDLFLHCHWMMGIKARQLHYLTRMKWSVLQGTLSCVTEL